MDNQESQIEATPEGLSKLEARQQEIKAELDEMKKRKTELERELGEIDSSITDTRYAIDLVANPEKLADEVAKWKQGREDFLDSITLEAVAEYPDMVVPLFSGHDWDWENGQKLLKKAKQFNYPDLEEEILSTFKKRREKADKVRNDPEYTKLIGDVSFPR